MNPLKALQALTRRAPVAEEAVRLAPRVELPPAVIAPDPASAPALNQISRRELLKRGAAQAASTVMDVSPAGALVKLAADPVKGAALKAAAQASDTAPIMRTLTAVDEAARDALMSSMNAGGDLDSLLNVWFTLRPKLEPKLGRKGAQQMDELADGLREGRVLSDELHDTTDTAWEFYERLGDALQSSRVRPEDIYRAMPPESRVPKQNQADWLRGVVNEFMLDKPTPEELRALERALFEGSQGGKP